MLKSGVQNQKRQNHKRVRGHKTDIRGTDLISKIIYLSVAGERRNADRATFFNLGGITSSI
jgi:hypothetical protein